MGRPDLAAELINQAIALNPKNSAAHSNLGGVYRLLGRLDQAIASHCEALRLDPYLPEIHNNLGNALKDRGRLPEAIAAYRQAIQLKPDCAGFHQNLGIALFENGDTDEAIGAFRQAIAFKADWVEAHNNLGAALSKASKFDEALAAYRRALELKPDCAEVHINLGQALTKTGRADEAIVVLHRALELRPDSAETFYNLAQTLQFLNQLEKSVDAYNHALELKPDYVEAHNALGNALVDQGRLSGAVAAYRLAFELKPSYPDAKFNYAVVLLLYGQFEEGLPLYEARWELAGVTKRSFSKPLWNGGCIREKRILIHSEQGLGDSIQFSRYAALAAALGGEVIVECRNELVKLFRSAKGVREVVRAGDPLPPFDLHAPMLSLPLILQTRRESIPDEIPYLFADPILRENWATRLDNDRSRLKVGLVWAGSPQNQRTKARDVLPKMLAPILRVEDINFLSLQLGATTEQLQQVTGATAIIDQTNHIQDFADTAALMMNLDLIISVDTAVAHLAGALGRPVWTLLPFVPDWRWGLEIETTPWYPTMRLFRQPVLGDWDSVIQRVADELKLLVKSRNP